MICFSERTFYRKQSVGAPDRSFYQIFFFIICWFPGDFFPAFLTISPLKWLFRIVVYCQSSVGVCSSNSLATRTGRRGTRNLIYILAFILLNLLITSTHYLYSTSPSSGIVAVWFMVRYHRSRKTYFCPRICSQKPLRLTVVLILLSCVEHPIEPLRVASRPPSWSLKPVLWELNSFLM